MAIRSLGQVSCSLNLGLPYSISYEYSPQNGTAITVFLVNQQGIYQRPQYMQKAQIVIGNSSFSMFVVASDIQLSDGRRVISVDFVDNTFLLDNYLIALTGRGCGFNVFQLGVPVDTRSPAQKQAAAPDPVAQQIAELTQFPDIEYKFNDFLVVLRQKFTVQASAPFDTAVTNAFAGTFREVLDQWCQFFNLSWFFENGIIKIFNPLTLSITLPTQPVDAIEFNSSEDIRSTYGKTCYNWFQQEGGQFQLNQTSNSSGPLLTRINTLFPVGYEFNLPQTPVDLNQVAASQFGENFWVLYNYYKGTLNVCGINPLTNGSASIYASVANLGGQIATLDQTVFQQQFEAFQNYGHNIAGRWYLSDEKIDLATDESFRWFDESQGQIFTFTHVDNKNINLQFLTPTNDGTNVIPETFINSFYSGVNYVGNRIAYQDTAINATNFSLNPAQTAILNNAYNAFGIKGSDAMNYGQIGTDNYTSYANIAVPSDLTTIFDNIAAYTTGFQPRFKSLPIKGIRDTDYATYKAAQNEPNEVKIVNGSQGGNVVSNTSVIKTLQQGAYSAYYDKYQTCSSAFATGPYFQHRFDPRQISSDNQLGVTFIKQAGNTYQLNRDYGFINALVNNPLLPQLAQPRTFPTRKVSFTLNYFNSVPTNFLTNGLVGLSVSVGDNGVTASYSYSNEMLQVPYPEKRFDDFAQLVRNSWIRQYRPTQVLS